MKSIRKIVFTAMLSALVCVATMIIKIPSPFKGYINLGDCMVLICGWISSPVYAFFAAGVGSAIADIFSGYALYAVPTFVIKGTMAIICFYQYNYFKYKSSENLSLFLSGVTSGVIMTAGYFLFEVAIYGYIPSVINIPANLIQGTIGLITAIVLIKIFKKNKINFN